MFSLRRSAWLIAVGVLLACAPAVRSDEWVSCRRDASTGQLLWLLELALCKWAPERQICHLAEKGFLPCLITYAVMDFLVIPPLRRRWDR